MNKLTAYFQYDFAPEVLTELVANGGRASVELTTIDGRPVEMNVTAGDLE
ncbi:MAG: hypothetical protein WAX14_12505 [Rhodococcus sp. (in: high G+C Gram-positive bacteria)]